MSDSVRTAPWQLAYLLLGALNSALLPFLLPLTVAQAAHRLDDVAYVSGAYNLGLLAAPLFGRLAERQHLHRPVFFASFVLLAAAFAAFPLATTLAGWFPLAAALGIAAGAAGTVAPLFVLNFAPQREWEARLGRLQSFNGAGQLAGLLLAGALAAQPPALGFGLAAGLALLALAVGRIGLPRDGAARPAQHPFRHLPLHRLLHPAQLGPALGGLLHHSHHLPWTAVWAAWRTPLSRFLLAWAAYNFGVAAFFAYYPLIMLRSYGIAPSATALVYATAAAIGIAVFLLASRLAARFGARAVFRAGVGLRLGGFVLLLLPFTVVLPGVTWIALAGFMMVMLAWPVLSVSGTALAARLTQVGEGAAMGLLNASGALATLLGTLLGGPLVRAVGFVAVPLLALAGLALAALLVPEAHPRSTQPADMPHAR